MDSVYYIELTPEAFRERIACAPIAYLPLGTLEWHGEHLPLGSDGLQSSGFFARLANEVGGIVLPMLFLGPDLRWEREGRPYYGMDYYAAPGEETLQLTGSAYWVDDGFFEALLENVMRQLQRAGFRIVVAHGHGPSTQAFVGKTDDWEAMGLKTFICWRGNEDDGLGLQTDHAAANETSLMMALHPELVCMEQLDPAPEVEPLGLMGDDPRFHASPEKGREALDTVAAYMRPLLEAALADVRRQG